MRASHILLLITSVFSMSTLNADSTQSSDQPESNQGSDATVIFMRSSFVGSAIKTTVYDVTDEETRLLGILKNKQKISYDVPAGKHVFMVVSEAADFMEADVSAGKTYYSIITPRTGAWKARFSMFPIRTDGTTKFNTDSKNFAKWKKKTKLTSLDDKSLAWFEKHKASVESKRAKYWPVWQQKTVEDLASRTINPADGL